jgi:predicted GTPase
MSIPIILIIGYTGSGKSSILNSLCGVKNFFKVGESLESETEETIVQNLKWKNSKKEFIGIDTPGIADSKGRDSQHISEMVEELKKRK